MTFSWKKVWYKWMHSAEETFLMTEREGKHFKKGESVFQRKGDIMVQMWKDKNLCK
jgi:hypothetical protein